MLRLVRIHGSNGESMARGFERLARDKGPDQKFHVAIINFGHLLRDDPLRERLCQHLRQAPPSLEELTFIQEDSEGQDEAELRQVPVEHFVQVLSSVAEHSSLESMRWYKLNIQGDLHPLALALRRFNRLKIFRFNNVAFSDHLHLLAKELRDLPQLIEVFWKSRRNQPCVQQLEVFTLLCGSKRLQELNACLGYSTVESNDEGEICTLSVKKFQNFCLAFQLSQIKHLRLNTFGGVELSVANMTDLGNAIEHHKYLESFHVQGSKLVSTDPLVKAVALNPNIVKATITNQETGVVSVEAMDLLVDALQTHNFTLSHFNLGNHHRLPKEVRKKILKIEEYCMLNREFPRGRILTDEAFPRHEFVDVIAQHANHIDDDFFWNELHRRAVESSLCFQLLLMKPALWLPDHPSEHSDDDESNDKGDRKRKARWITKS